MLLLWLPFMVLLLGPVVAAVPNGLGQTPANGALTSGSSNSRASRPSGSRRRSRPPPPPPPPMTSKLPPFDTPWIRSDSSAVNLTLLEDPTLGLGVLRWTRPKKPTVLVTYLPAPLSVGTPGQTATVTFRWRSDGENKCDPFDWADNKTCSCGQKLKESCEAGKGTPKCAKTSINCIEGTGDFRIALWDTSAAPATAKPADDFCPQGSGAVGDSLHACMTKIGSLFREYQFRTMPHVSTTYFHPKDSEPGGFFAKINSTDAFGDHRLPGHWGKGNQSGVFPGFAAPRGVWVDMELTVARKTAASYEISIAMGQAKYSYLHSWTSSDVGDRPTVIDAMGIWFPNSRSYAYVDLGPSKTPIV
eukprot:COSAG01_NODE_7413_length_3217_cov_10.390314_3_plen_360_part_00